MDFTYYLGNPLNAHINPGIIHRQLVPLVQKIGSQ